MTILALTCHAAQAANAPSTQSASTQPSGIIKGTITATGVVPLSEMVVFLQADDNQQVSVPTDVVKVSQIGATFSPAMVIICVGQTVDFVNDENRSIDHNVFSNSPTKTFDLGLFKPGESRQVTFDNTGPVFLYCSIHRYMDGVIYVAPTPYFSRVDGQGKYEIDGVPLGHWVVHTWQRRRRFPKAQAIVKVTQDDTTVQDLTLQKP